MHLFSKKAAKKMAAYQKELIETHYQEVDNMSVSYTHLTLPTNSRV